MNTALALTVIGLRASYFVACVLAFVAFGGPAIFAIRQIIKSHLPEPGDILPVALWIGALGGVSFIGKRVLLAVVLHQPINFDRGNWDATFTGLGFVLLTFANFLPVWSKARANGNESYGAAGFGLITICGIAFAVFYAAVHNLP